MKLERVLLPSLSEHAFDRALAELRSVVGETHVIADAEGLLPYGRLMLPAEDSNHQPSGAVAPASVEEIQTIRPLLLTNAIPNFGVLANATLVLTGPCRRAELYDDQRPRNPERDADGVRPQRRREDGSGACLIP
jgi:hypothetical protein